MTKPKNPQHGASPARRIIRELKLIPALPLLLLPFHLFGVETSNTDNAFQKVSETVQPADKGADYQVWQQIQTLRDAKGNTLLVTNPAYVELETGKFYRDGDRWLETRAVIEAHPGGAIARYGGHKVIFVGDFLSDVVVDMETPDAKRLQSRVLGLSYLDTASGTSVWLADAASSTGVIITTNQVLYAAAFSGVKADVRYTYTKAGLEQDVILREQPPTPESFGLESKTTRLQVITEFLSPPNPIIETKTLGTDVERFEDQTLDFGVMQMVAGKAFMIGASESDSAETPVSKRWTVADGRTLLIEEVELPRIAAQLESLPAKKRTAFFWKKSGKAVATAKLNLPTRPNNKLAKRAMQLAKLQSPDRGLVLDYVLVSSQANFTFKGDTTYYVSGVVNLSGTTTIEGGAVIKYNTGGTAISVSGAGLVCQTGPYRPAILTSKHDDSVGEIIAGSNHSPSKPTTTLPIFLHTQVGNNPFKYLHFRYAGIALSQTYRPVWHCQFVECNIAISGDSQNSYGSTLELHNVLFTKCTTAVRNQPAYWTGSCLGVTGEHVTADQFTQFLLNGCNYGGPASSLTNSILTSYGSLGVPLSLFNSINSPGSSSGFYQSAGAGNYYLVAPQPGTPDINPQLLAELAKKTTYPPNMENTSQTDPVTIPAGTPWSQFASRNTGTPDIGYHYDPLDHFVGNATLDGTLSVTAGTAVGFFGTYGFQSGTFQITGTPLNRSTVAHYSAVQEQSVAWGANASATYLLKNGSMPSLNWRFADVTTAGGAFFGGGSATTMDVAHCSLLAPRMTCDGGNYATLGFTNNIIERGDLVLLSCYGGTYFANFYNNLFLNNGNLGLGNACSGNILPNFAVKNNLFIKGSFTYGTSSGYAPVISHNGYYQTTVTSQGTSPITINNPAFQTGALGPYYYPTTVNGQNLATLVNAGSTTADVLSLCPFTTRTDQAREGVSTVDIGFHYVALDGNGNPQDINFNGPDYDEIPASNPQTVSPPVCRDTARTITLTGSGNSCTPLTFIIVSGPAHATLNTVTSTSDTSADVTYTPTPLYCGTDSFTFKVRNNGRDSSPATVTLNVGNEASATTFSVETCKNTAKPFTLSGTDSCAVTPVFQIVSGPNSGLISDTSPNLTYTPNPGFCGTDSLQYKVDGNCNDSDLATVTFTVGDPNPIANCQDVITGKDSPITFTLTGADSCIDTLTFVKDSDPASGTLTQFNPNTGAVTYQPNSGFEGTDTFTFHVNNCGFSSGLQTVTINVVPGPTLTTECRPNSIILTWTLPPFLQTLALSGYIQDFQIFRCSSVGCTPPSTPFATLSDAAITLNPLRWHFVDTGVTPGQTFCYAITFRHKNSCDNVTVFASPRSATSCNQVCAVPQITISGNNASLGLGPIGTFDFGSGALLNSFVPDGAANGRGIEIHNGEIFYTDLTGGFGPSDGIHVAPYGNQGSGGADIRVLDNPNPTAGIAALSFHNATLYALAGYPDQQLQVFKLNPTTGAVMGSPISIGSPASEDADGFTVLPNGNFLINDFDTAVIYREYSSTTGTLVSGGLVIDLSSFGFAKGTGVATAPDGQSLYFIANISAPQTLIQTSLTGQVIETQPISGTVIEDIDVVAQ